MAVNSTQFQIVQSYMLLLKPSLFMRSRLKVSHKLAEVALEASQTVLLYIAHSARLVPHVLHSLVLLHRATFIPQQHNYFCG